MAAATKVLTQLPSYTPSLDVIFEHLKQDMYFAGDHPLEFEYKSKPVPIISPKPRRLRPKQIPVIIQLLPRLFLGNQTAADDLKLLKEHNIQCVVSCRELLAEGLLVSHPGITYKRVWADDQPHVPLQEAFGRVNQWVMAVSDDSPVLIHCWQGVSRSVTLACVHVMDMLGYSDKEALQLIRSVSPRINPNDGFLSQLSDYFITRKEYWSSQSAMMCTELCSVYGDHHKLVDIIHLCLEYLGKFHSRYFTWWPTDSMSLTMDCPS